MGRQLSRGEYTGPGIAWVDRPMNPEAVLPPDLRVLQQQARERIVALRLGARTGDFTQFHEVKARQQAELAANPENTVE